MESNKYYTPNVEEFYIGFEYQIKDPAVRDWDKEFACKEDFLGHDISCNPGDYYKINFGWVNKIFQINDSISKDDINYIQINNILEPKLTDFRVKYLDQEDIESLGFILKGKSIDLWFERKKIYLRDDGHHLQNIKLQYGKHDQRLKITFHYTAGEEQIHFEGTIKNKSELKKLLKQLGIE